MGGIPISEAARRLGLSVEATRMRVRRGSIPAHKGEDGLWYIDLDTVQGAGPKMEEPVQGASQSPMSGLPPVVPDTVIQAMIVMQRQMDILAGELAVKNQQLEVKDQQLADAATERAELRRLLGNSQMMLTTGRPGMSGRAEQPLQDESHVQLPHIAPVGVQRVEQASERGLWQRFVRAMRGA